jgi:hypothetical protein
MRPTIIVETLTLSLRVFLDLRAQRKRPVIVGNSIRLASEVESGDALG